MLNDLFALPSRLTRFAFLERSEMARYELIMAGWT
jgi:hypothetical protein